MFCGLFLRSIGVVFDMTKHKPIDPITLLIYFVVVLIIFSVLVSLIIAAVTNWLFGIALIGAIILFGWFLSVVGILQRDNWFVKTAEKTTEWVISELSKLIKK